MNIFVYWKICENFRANSWLIDIMCTDNKIAFCRISLKTKPCKFLIIGNSVGREINCPTESLISAMRS